MKMCRYKEIIFNNLNKFNMKRLINILQPIKTFFIRFVRRCFSNALNFITTIAIIEIILQMIIVIYENNYTVWNMGHVIGWSIWLAILLIYRMFRK